MGPSPSGPQTLRLFLARINLCFVSRSNSHYGALRIRRPARAESRPFPGPWEGRVPPRPRPGAPIIRPYSKRCPGGFAAVGTSQSRGDGVLEYWSIGGKTRFSLPCSITPTLRHSNTPRFWGIFAPESPENLFEQALITIAGASLSPLDTDDGLCDSLNVRISGGRHDCRSEPNREAGNGGHTG